ncbi:DUF2213 domain-containing protein [bacterium]|nr:DUF2213 domain-containing protein [bacterium]
MPFYIDSYPIKNHEIDNLGYLRFLAPISRVGELIYLDNEGEKYTELVTPECLIKSLPSFKTKIITDNHPEEMVSIENSARYSKGMSGYTGFFDGSFLWLTGTIFDKELIKKIVSGEANQISPGYTAKRLLEGDQIVQMDREGNHLSIVKKGRNGSNVAIKLDGDEKLYVCDSALELADLPDVPEVFKEFGNSKGKSQILVTNIHKDRAKKVQIILNDRIYTIDGDDSGNLQLAITALKDDLKVRDTRILELEAKVAETEKAQSELSEARVALESQLSAVSGERDGLKTKLDSAESCPLSEEVEKRVKFILEILPEMKKLDAAFDLTGDISKLDTVGIKSLFLKKKYPSLDLENKNDEYIEGVYQALKVSSSEKSDSSQVLETINGLSGTQTTELDARQAYIDEMFGGKK